MMDVQNPKPEDQDENCLNEEQQENLDKTKKKVNVSYNGCKRSVTICRIRVVRSETLDAFLQAFLRMKRNGIRVLKVNNKMVVFPCYLRPRRWQLPTKKTQEHSIGRSSSLIPLES